MRLQLAELQKLDKKAQKIRAEALKEYKKIDKILHHQELPFVSEII